MLEARSLRRRYGDLLAVDDVSFEIRAGEAFGLLGPNGAGKSTTIHMLAGVVTPDGGEIVVDGQRDPSRPDVRRAIGVAPQGLALYDELSGEENLAVFARLYGLAGARLAERVTWALDFAGLADRRRQRVQAYSGGMKRRLNLACALVHEPKVLICDEPTVGVDPQSRNHIFDCIESLRDGGMTLLYTTHYMEEAQRLCDRVAIMDHGRILAIDTVDALVEAHGGLSVVQAELATPPASGVEVPGRLEGTTLRVDTDRPFELVASLGRGGLDIASLRVERPDLERVFLQLTGRSLRDA
ncbi:MAG: ABC transporter ATP-binding protein [Planctomycetes bacterium]|nr:ABC transporter ATP-binding protein [Planctomycetota bacterium]